MIDKETIGIDCGSAACKGVLMRNDTIIAHCIQPTGWSPRETSLNIRDQLLKHAQTPEDDVCIVATGYGRVSIDFAHKTVTEITCHALGSEFLFPGVCTVIDIGGQDSKVISLRDGKVMSFQMNDKCAAGTGRFLEMSAHRMGIELDEFATLLQAGKSCSLSSMCAVFADSEIISLLAAGKSREEVAGGIVQSIVSRVIALASRIDITPPISLTGGLANLKGLRIALEQQLGHSVTATSWSRFAGAIGAAKK